MMDLQESIVLEQSVKRKPTSKAGRLLCVVRDEIINAIKQDVKNNKVFIPTNRIAVVQRLNRRIVSRLKKEDLQSIKQLDMFTTNERTVVEFMEDGKRIRASFTGGMAQAKSYLRLIRDVKIVNWLHWFTVEERLAYGEWFEMEVC